jgi:dUTP pyrophosphatase
MDVFVKLENDELLPSYCTKDAAGADIKANISEDVIISPAMSALIPTGIYLAIPEGFEAQVRPKSGLALNNQITILNTPGTIDADYRGEIKVILINHGHIPFIVKPKMKIAQLVFAPVVRPCFIKENQELSSTIRGAKGFGSSGLF